MSDPLNGLEADHAYWLSNLRLRDASGGLPLGRIDAFSRAFGVTDSATSATQRGLGIFAGSATTPGLPYLYQSKSWTAAAKQDPANQIDITTTNIAAVTIDAQRAHLSCHPVIRLHSDGPVSVRIVNCSPT